MRYHIPLVKWNFSIPACGYAARVTVPHTWNIDDPVMHHRGAAEYETTVFVDPSLQGSRAFLYFGAVYHTVEVTVNGQRAGGHGRSGFTPFRLDVTDLLVFGGQNTIRVWVSNAPSEEMLPHGTDFDWADDGGLIRRAALQFMAPDAAEFLRVEEKLTSIQNGLCSGSLLLKTAFLDGTAQDGVVKVIDYADGQTVIEQPFIGLAGELTVNFENLKLWSCHSLALYRVRLETAHDSYEVRTGLRTIAVEGERILLNGEEIFLKGCEWMPGSHPDYGMAEPLEHSIRSLRQLKDAGCVFTRFHWQQDDAVYDWCDENGLLVQEEIPYWGKPKQADPLQLSIAQQQADEMVFFHAHHPSIVCWGVGNELGAELPETIDYVRQMSAYFKAQDSRRLVNYVSNTLSLTQNAEKDDAALHGDIAMWNDYLGLWEPTDDLEDHLRRTCQKAAGMPLVVSEFGLCEPAFSGGDEERARLLRSRVALYKTVPNLRGYVWFSLNDYRTQFGEEGEGKLRRRVHGSTDLYGNEKPSYQLLQGL